jgi:predicted Zn-dependent protease
MRHTLTTIAFATVVSTALLAGCGSKVVNPVSGQSERSAMTETQEVAEGKKAHVQVLEEYTALKNPKLQAYVNDIGQKLAKQSQRANLVWTFTVLDSPEINAFALPGGYVYVTRGIMAYMESEADLAGVIGHEIGHVTARHGAQRATRQQNAGLGVLAASVLGAVLEAKGVGGAGDVLGGVAQNAAQGYVAKYGREQELQADGLGAEYLSRVQLDPRNMIDVIKVLKNQELFAADLAKSEGRAAPAQNSWLASHPSNDQRLERIIALSAQYKSTTPYQDEGRTRYLQMMDGVAFGESADQGLTRGRNFYHDSLNFAITAPAGWKIQNEPEQLTLVNAARDAGVILQLVPPKAGNTHEEIIRNLVKPASGRGEPLKINGLSATHFVGTQRADNGKVSNLELTVITGAGGGNYILVYSAKDAAVLQANRAGMQEAERSFRGMTAADKSAAKPWVLRTATMPRGGFADLARTSPLANPEQQLKLINGVYAGGEIKPGAVVKVVVQ